MDKGKKVTALQENQWETTEVIQLGVWGPVGLAAWSCAFEGTAVRPASWGSGNGVFPRIFRNGNWPVISQVKSKGKITLVRGFVGFEWGTGSCLCKITRRKEKKAKPEINITTSLGPSKRGLFAGRLLLEARYESELRAMGESRVLNSPSATKVKSTRSRCGYAGWRA